MVWVGYHDSNQTGLQTVTVHEDLGHERALLVRVLDLRGPINTQNNRMRKEAEGLVGGQGGGGEGEVTWIRNKDARTDGEIQTYSYATRKKAKHARTHTR